MRFQLELPIERHMSMKVDFPYRNHCNELDMNGKGAFFGFSLVCCISP